MTRNNEMPTPYGYVKPKSDSAVSPFFVFAEEMTQDWMKGVFTVPVYQAPPTGSWEPATNAPRDGREVLLWLGGPDGRMALACWNEFWRVWVEVPLPDPNETVHGPFGIGPEIPTYFMRPPAGPFQQASAASEIEPTQ